MSDEAHLIVLFLMMTMNSALSMQPTLPSEFPVIPTEPAISSAPSFPTDHVSNHAFSSPPPPAPIRPRIQTSVPAFAASRDSPNTLFPTGGPMPTSRLALWNPRAEIDLPVIPDKRIIENVERIFLRSLIVNPDLLGPFSVMVEGKQVQMLSQAHQVGHYMQDRPLRQVMVSFKSQLCIPLSCWQVLLDWLLRDDSVRGLTLEQLRDRFLMTHSTYKGLLPYFNRIGEFEKWSQVCFHLRTHARLCPDLQLICVLHYGHHSGG